MGIQTSSVLYDGTIAASAGTPVDLLVLNGNNDTVNAILDDGSEFLSNIKVAFQVKVPKVSPTAPNGFTQNRNIVKLTWPKVLANGSTTLNSVSMNMGVDVETSDAEVQTMLSLAAQIATDPDFSDYWKKQSLA